MKLEELINTFSKKLEDCGLEEIEHISGSMAELSFLRQNGFGANTRRIKGELDTMAYHFGRENVYAELSECLGNMIKKYNEED